MNAASADSRGESTSTMVDNSGRSIVLIVDDDPWIRLLLHELLTDEGYAVEEASNGSAALRLAQRHPPALVLLDLVLPEQSGLALLTELKSTRATAHVPVIAVTARTDLLVRAAELADAVVAKPFDIGELLAKISAVCRRSKSAAPCDEVHRFSADLPRRHQPR
jgi:DNA-binding response OmpR family regulator